MANPHAVNALNKPKCHSQVGMPCSSTPNTLSQFVPHHTSHRSTVLNQRHCPPFHHRSSGPHAGERCGPFPPEPPGFTTTRVRMVKEQFELASASNQPFVFLSSPARLTPTPFRSSPALTISCALLFEPPARRPGGQPLGRPDVPNQPVHRATHDRALHASTRRVDGAIPCSKSLPASLHDTARALVTLQRPL
jgi:hypothetical protein